MFTLCQVSRSFPLSYYCKPFLTFIGYSFLSNEQTPTIFLPQLGIANSILRDLYDLDRTQVYEKLEEISLLAFSSFNGSFVHNKVLR